MQHVAEDEEVVWVGAKPVRLEVVEFEPSARVVGLAQQLNWVVGFR